MAIDIREETPLTMTEAAQILPGRPNVATLFRWRTKGCKGVKLESICIGSRVFTTHEALDRFILGTSRASTGVTQAPPAQRHRELAAADAILARAGI